MIWTLIPAKSFARSKSRLAPVLDAGQRARLSAALLARTLRVARAAFGEQPLLVVSPDEDVAAVARACGANQVVLARTHGLNAQLAEAAELVPPTAPLLVLHADLPLLQPDDLVALATEENAAVLCPDRRREGTNALLQRAAPRCFFFGEMSFARHRQHMARHGLHPAVLQRPGLTFDLDLPDDWRALIARLNDTRPGTNSFEAVLELLAA